VGRWGGEYIHRYGSVYDAVAACAAEIASSILLLSLFMEERDA
jgi:hypothetical protein